MARGLPDGTLWGKGLDLYNVFNLGELGSWLSGAGMFDPKGKVVFLDIFDKGIGSYLFSGDGGGEGHGLSAVYAWPGALSLRMTSGDTGGDDYSLARYLGWPTHGKLALQFVFCTDGQRPRVNVLLRYDYATRSYRFGLRYNFSNYVLDYREPDGSWTELETDVKLDPVAGSFHNIKVMVDLETRAYQRWLIDDYGGALTQVQTNSGGGTSPRGLTIGFTIESLGNSNYSVYVGGVLLTKDAY